MKRRTVLLVATQGLSMLACEFQQTEPDEYCFTTAQCPPGTVCNAYEGSCQPEPEDGFSGTIRCVVNGAAEDAPGQSQSSDVMGSVDGERYVFAGAPGCNSMPTIDPDTGQVTATLSIYLPLAHDFDTGLQISLGRLESDTAQFAFGPPSQDQPDVNSAKFLTQPSGAEWRVNSRVHALSAGGFGSLRGHVAAGQVISGYLDLQMVPTAPEVVDWWAECEPSNLAVCGESIDAVCVPGSGGGSFCSRYCGDDSPCEAGQSCHDGLCLLDCAEDADCPEPLSCALSTEPAGCS